MILKEREASDRRPAVAEEPEVQVAGINRCPFCHADVVVDREEWLACRGCLARHHAACWREGGRCSCCGNPGALAPGRAAASGAAREPGTAELLAHGARGLGRLVGLILLLPRRVLRLVWWLLQAANRRPRLTGAVVVMAVLLLVTSSRPTVYVHRTHPVEHTVYRDPPAPSGAELNERGEFTRARQLLAQQVARGDASARSDLGWALLGEGRPAEALEAYRVAGPQQPGRAFRSTWGPVLALGLLDRRAEALEVMEAWPSGSRNVYTELYRALWTGRTEGLAGAADPTRWRQALAAWGQGTLTDEALLQAAEDAGGQLTLAQRRCEAHNYVGLRADLAGDAARAQEHYRAAVETSVFNYIEYMWSLGRLRSLQVGGRPLGPALAPPAAPPAAIQPATETVTTPLAPEAPPSQQD